MSEILKDGEYKLLMKKNITNPCENAIFKMTMVNLYKDQINEKCVVSKVK